ncbi:IucA/IucC family protein, partial [Streptomyces sp. UNOC14_S4]|uniref:IucA/IucC family protein n=1 Tax=Streptomyces sp. UNOC14_S4 TaxID=2872340 RepID=UPI0023AE982A
MNRAATRGTWAEAGRRLLVKAVEEFAYEELLTPRQDEAAGVDDAYRLDLSDGVHWTFRAARGTFGTWRLAGPPVRHPAPADADADADGDGEAGPERFLLDARGVLGWDGPTTAEVLRELTATRRADAASLARALPAARLADLDHLDLEAHQDGHPCMLLNKGRLGFSAADAAAYAPETADAVHLVWAAVHTGLAAYSGVPGLDADTLLKEELDDDVRERFTGVLETACAYGPYAADDFVWLPVHPFHW